MNEYVWVESEPDWRKVNVGLVLEELIDGDFVVKLSAEEVVSFMKRAWL